MNAKTRKRFEQILMFSTRIQRVMESESLENFLADEDIQDAILYQGNRIRKSLDT